MQFHFVARDKTCLAVHSELFTVLAFYFPSQSSLWQIKLLIRYEVRQPHANSRFILWCVFKGPNTTFLDNSGLKEGSGVEKTLWNRNESGMN